MGQEENHNSTDFRFIPSKVALMSTVLAKYTSRYVSESAHVVAGYASAAAALKRRHPPEKSADTDPGEQHTTQRSPDKRSPDKVVQLPKASTGLTFDPTAAAFFDVDNTLVQGASIVHLARGLARHKFFTSTDVAQFAWKQIKFRVSGQENAHDIEAGREQALSFVAGRQVSEVQELCEAIFDESVMERLWPGTRALAQMHLDAGHQVWLVTASPIELASVIASRLGLTGALGTVAESIDGVYTGKLVGDILHGPGKAHAVNALAQEENFALENCYAYSDSHNDMPMLTMVGHPVAVNPDAALQEVARARGWSIKDFRTVRKVAKVGVPTALALGAVGGAMAAGVSYQARERSGH